jgi:hypothetical protein
MRATAFEGLACGGNARLPHPLISSAFGFARLSSNGSEHSYSAITLPSAARSMTTAASMISCVSGSRPDVSRSTNASFTSCPFQRARSTPGPSPDADATPPATRFRPCDREHEGEAWEEASRESPLAWCCDVAGVGELAHAPS